MGKAKKITGAALVAPTLPEKELPDSGMVWIIKNNGKESFVSAQLAKTLINKSFAKLK